MTVSTTSQLRQLSDSMDSIGERAINSDFTMVIPGFEQYSPLIKQFPWPVLTPGEAIEVPGPLGSKDWLPSQVNTAFQGAITVSETVVGDAENLLAALLINKGRFKTAILYEGTPDEFHRAKRIRNLILSIEPVDRDQENRSQLLTLTGTAYFKFLGGSDDIKGNI